MFCKSAVSRAVGTFVIALSIPLLSSCDLQQQLTWSPDGKKLAVVASDGVRLSVDGGLHLSEPVETNGHLLNWFSDSKRLLVVSNVGYDNWPELEKNLKPEEVESVKATANVFITALEKCDGDFEKCQTALKNQNFNAENIDNALVFLNFSQAEKMKKYAGKEAKYVNLGGTVSTLKSYEVDKSTLKLKDDYLRAGRRFDYVKVSPSNEFVFAVSASNDELRTIELKNSKGELKLFPGDFGDYPDWDLNTDIIYAMRKTDAEGKGKPDFELVAIDIKRAPNEAVKHLSDVYFGRDKVRSTVDGNVLFVAARAGSLGAGKGSKLISYNIASGKLKSLYTAGKDDRLESFEVSPDGKAVTIPGSYGALSILNLQTGKKQVVSQSVANDDRDTFTAVWRNNEEVCYNKLSSLDSLSTVAVFSVKTGKSTVVSSDWPAEATKALLPKRAKAPSFEKFVDSLRKNK